MHLSGCSNLCEGAPANFVAAGAAGDAVAATPSPIIDTGTARTLRLLLAFGAAAGNKVLSVSFSDDGETWYRCDDAFCSCDDDLETEGKQLVALCLENAKRYVRVHFMTPNAFTIISELAGMRHTPSGACCNDATASGSIDCDELTLVEA